MKLSLKKLPKWAKIATKIVFVLTLLVGVAYHFYMVEKLKADIRVVEERNQTLRKGVEGYYSMWKNLDSGGNDDKWFEENAMTRTGQDEHLLKIADELGLKHIRKTSLKYNKETGRNTLGYYKHSGYGKNDGYPIVVKKGLDPWEEKATIAHEYIHYIYNNSYASVKDTNLASGLLNMYGSNSWFFDRMTPYIRNQTLSVDELLAISCTEISDKYMDKYVLSWCNKWIDRSKLRFRI